MGNLEHSEEGGTAFVRPPLLYLNVLVIATCGLVYELIAGTLASYVLGDSVSLFLVSPADRTDWSISMLVNAATYIDTSAGSFLLMMRPRQIPFWATWQV